MPHSKRGSAEIDGLVASAGESGIETSDAFSYRRKYRQGSLRNAVNRVHHLECRRDFEISRGEAAVVYYVRAADPRLDRQDWIFDQRKRMCQQAAANEPLGALRDPARR